MSAATAHSTHVTSPALDHRTPAEGTPAINDLASRLILAMGGLAASIAASQFVSLPRTPYLIAVSVHVMTLVVAFGAVVVVDWYGLLWMRGVRNLRASLQVSNAVDPLIWLGLAGIVVSGIFLHPNLSSGITQLKLGFVALLMFNGVLASGLRARLNALPDDVRPADLTPQLWRRLMIATVCSQVGWWGAIIVGFVNDGIRRG